MSIATATGVVAVDDAKWQRARLIPVAGVRGARDAEQRATSALLAVLSVVRDLSDELLTPMGASSAKKAVVETFTEVTMDSGGKSVRPDGLIRVTYGKSSFTALVEVKTGNNKLDTDQVKSYWQAARQAKFDHVITISNEIAASGFHPVRGLRVRKTSPVQVSHLSWVRILSTALRIKNHKGVADPEQAWILGELVRYLEHHASGVMQMADMGSDWAAIRDGARAGTLNKHNKGLTEVAAKIDEMFTFASLVLSSEIGEDVDGVDAQIHIASTRISRCAIAFWRRPSSNSAACTSVETEQSDGRPGQRLRASGEGHVIGVLKLAEA